ncbi:ABC-type transport system, involved in lipoprotein release, permease component [Candidatus Methanoperedens nitroreducens]|uniref:ABC-type transport system, involved in lipoprotein release, permease component n=1 Tax=Candidatus Methanoperedens nitratireducens TaxID=1392998 RepID=A0A062V3B2_9EURY|nr:ABC transporter permease [Candidatus Methanoperedens nitroreducens]KCZ71103.1 ABC-type transport system, involved in lipoprotein release, permease component [Candidatus Methanoperedens nitroreducens]MDJ1421521.1 ABC transporter permease [Candidatus Methanoperedens sp.]
MFDLIIRSLTQRKMRTGLTIFGIALGIFAVVVMDGMSEHMNLVVDRSLKLMADNIQVQPDGTLGGIGSLDESKVRQVKRVPGVQDAHGVLIASLDPEGGGGFGGGDMVFGVLPEKQLKDAKLAAGRYLVPGDGYRAVIGSSIARKFNLKVGDELEIKSKRMQRTSSITSTRNVSVVGILEYTGSIFDSAVQMPLDRAQKFYGMENTVSFIYAKPAPGADPEELAKRIELSVEKVKSESPDTLRKMFQGQLVIFSLITISAAMLAAIIGGLSVMNTMLMSVSERTKEFGLLKALGAERKSILFMTMGEAAFMGVIGGIAGIAAGWITVYFLNSVFLSSQGSALFSITPRLAAVALLFAMVLGIVCGTYPAYRATKMSPMEALRYE